MNCFRKIRFLLKYGFPARGEMKVIRWLVRKHQSTAVAGHVPKRWVHKLTGVPMRDLTKIANSIGVKTQIKNKVSYYSFEDARYMLRALWQE